MRLAPAPALLLAAALPLIAGCATSSAGDNYRYGKNGFEKDSVLAADTYRNECADRSAPACAALAEMLFVGEGVFRDRGQALSLWKQACDLGDMKACGRSELTQCFQFADAPPDAGVSRGTSGRLESEQINAVMTKAMPCYLLCYEVARDSQPGLRGEVAPKFLISPTGRVASAELKKNTTGSQSVGKCVVEVTNGLTFPQPRGGGPVQVTYPLRFDVR